MWSLIIHRLNYWYVHLIAARAMDIADGFPAMTILPADPLTGEPSPGPIPIRYEPTGTIGDMDLAGLVGTHTRAPWAAHPCRNSSPA